MATMPNEWSQSVGDYKGQHGSTLKVNNSRENPLGNAANNSVTGRVYGNDPAVHKLLKDIKQAGDNK